jgi:PAS domain S-box-containing protein
VKILVVEDNEITRRLVRMTLRAESYEVLEAADAATALRLAVQERPDLIVQDLRLPDLDGFDLLHRLRALPQMVDVPVIAFSGFVSRLEEARASAIGFTDFLVKPLQPSELIRAIQTHMPSRAVEAGAGEGRRVLLADDDPVQRKLGRVRLELQGFRVQTAGDGVEALELARGHTFDVVVCDVLMPRLDGFGLCLAIRQDRALAGLPVVLCSNTYLEAEDEALARRLGANAFVVRTPDMAEVSEAALAALEQGAPATPVAAPGELRDRHVYRVITQLEHQAGINAGLTQRCASQSAALSILSTISDTLARSFDSTVGVDELLASCLEAGGFSVGVLYLLEDDGRLSVAAQGGYHQTSLAEVEGMFGHEALFRATLASGTPLAIPSPAVDSRVAAEFLSRTGPASALVLPIVFREERLGALLVATDLRDLGSEESLDFARTIGNQIGQVIALRRAFVRVAAAERQYRGIFENAVEGIFQKTPEGRYLIVNPTMARIFGFATPEEMVGSITDIGSQLYVDPEQRADLLHRLAEHGSVTRFESRGRRRDGAIIWTSQSMRAVHDAAGRVRFYEGVLEDITERKKAEAATTALAQTARALLESPDLAAVTRLVTDNVWRLLDARSASVYRLDPESGDLVAMGHSTPADGRWAWTERFPAGTGVGALVVRTRRLRMTPDVLQEADVRFTPTTRRSIEAETERAILAVPLLIGDRVFGALIIRDRTGRAFDAAESRLAHAFADQAAIALDKARLFEEAQAGRDFLASVARNSADGIVAADADGRVTFFSYRAEEIWGRGAADVLGRPLAELLGESDQAQALLTRLHVPQRIQDCEITVHDGEGREVELSVSFAFLHDSAGAVTGLVAVARDTTVRKRTEAALRQSEKLAAMSSLVAGLAHELNNPLSVILAHSALLAQGGRGRAETRAAKITTAAERCARLVRNFLSLARQHPLERQRVLLAQVVRETVELVAYPLRVDGVTVTLDLGPEVPPLWADPHQLQQVLLNLLTNAHQAVRTVAPPRAITVTTRLEPDGVTLRVADNGPGVSPAVRERIFEPFFTTKPVGQGTGLGLSLCQGIVEGHGGTLSLESPPEGGAAFSISLPSTAPPAAEPLTVGTEDTVAGLTVLVVDDEADVAEVLADMLSIDGHRAEIVPNGRVALERLRTTTYDLVMSDLRMPELDGAGLHRALEAAGHPILRRVVFVTGDVLGPEAQDFLERTGVPTLAKPFVFGELRNVIQQVVGVAPTPRRAG